MEFIEVREGLAKILVPKAERIYDAPVFYNPVMALNRDISVLAVEVLKPRTVLDALSATGIRGIRYALETPAKEVWLNDISKEAFNLILKNVRLNLGVEGEGISEKRIAFRGEKEVVANLDDANRLMAEKFRYFDFLDLDPFGSPVEFLDTALRSIRRRGVLAVTATDTGVLCGAYLHACRRKYLAEPIRGELCHEAGLRILIGTVVRYAAKYDLGVDVLLAYYRDHYFRAFLRLKSGARKADESLSNLGYLWQEPNGRFEYTKAFLPEKLPSYGPLWLGPLKTQKFVDEMLSLAGTHSLAHKKTLSFIKTLLEELDVPFHYDTHALARKNNLQVGKLADIIEALREGGYHATRTHFSPVALKTDAPFEEVLGVLKSL
ncbi:tRNA (guanine(10)-N(2))-dimethyltransferase [Thermococcus thioreducens]|uniref:tRNA (guanine(26)-N(2))-dimethyltransferase n=1 Tax=Thermococcus thioreducens TaxID=277988 RepID=A0A0Q2XPF9_9EURY|nr:tRNA (guanine(10)-N(2))-dimethyltransferase [Thermococcus thioreducens]ASJ12443.1 tRNA (guanine(10)-N(2))-dimethyltransferase [Thermococcus thioreducens]KQH83172.1 tRNA (guanine-N2)-dimethyltransferase [Thermococcus thioreducens]SEV90715.1 N(2),N(2)-dimethylguanosine tRNA methyltransferase [Thermococcus thioreducens]